MGPAPVLPRDGTLRTLHAALDRALSGDTDGDIGLLDHDEVYDGCTDRPRPPAPAAVDEITRALAVGFQGFRGRMRVYLVEHFLAPCAFFRGARLRRRCVIVWID